MSNREPHFFFAHRYTQHNGETSDARSNNELARTCILRILEFRMRPSHLARPHHLVRSLDRAPDCQTPLPLNAHNRAFAQTLCIDVALMLVPFCLPRSGIVAIPQLRFTETELLKLVMHLVAAATRQARVLSHLVFDCLPPSLASVFNAARPVAHLSLDRLIESPTELGYAALDRVARHMPRAGPAANIICRRYSQPVSADAGGGSRRTNPG